MATPPGPPPTMTTAPATVADVDAAPGPTIPPSYVATENGYRCLFCGKTWPRKIGITYHLVRPPSCTLRSHKSSSADVFALPALHAPNAAPPSITIVHVLEVSPPLVAHMQSHARLIPSATLCAPQSSRVVAAQRFGRSGERQRSTGNIRLGYTQLLTCNLYFLFVLPIFVVVSLTLAFLVAFDIVLVPARPGVSSNSAQVATRKVLTLPRSLPACLVGKCRRRTP